MNINCEYAGLGGCCLCSACQSMRKTIESLSNMNTDEILDREEVKQVFREMEQALEDCRREK